MKKILLFLLPLFALAQNPTNFPYGLKNKVAPADSTPAYFVTSQTDGVHKKTPAALIALKSDIPYNYAKIVYVNATSPNTATIFDVNNPPVTNNNLLKNDINNLYIGTDASTWVYNGSAYVTKNVPASSNFYINNTTIDAGNSKDNYITRPGSVKTEGYFSSGIGYYVNRNGSNTAQIGGYFNFSNAIGSNSMMFQLNASNGLDLWNYASSSWNKRFTFAGDGGLFLYKKPILSAGAYDILTRNTAGEVESLPSSTFAAQDGTILYHYVKWFVPTGSVSSSGTTVTSVGTQFSSGMVGAKLTISGEQRIITAYTSSTVVTVASEYSINYSGIVAGSWGVYSRSYVTSSGTTSNILYNTIGLITMYIESGVPNAPAFSSTDGVFQLNSNGMDFGSNVLGLRWSSTSVHPGAKDLGLRRNAAGVLEIYNGVTADGNITNRRDLLVRNITGGATLTGTPTAPTAAAGTNTTQIATTAFVQAANAGNVKTTGDQTIAGLKEFTDGININSTVNEPFQINKSGVKYAHMIVDNVSNEKGFGLFGSYLALENTSTNIDPQLRIQNSPENAFATIQAYSSTNPLTKHSLYLLASGEVYVRANNNDRVTLEGGSFYFKNGNLLVNTNIDNGADKLQVNGTASFSSSVNATSFNGGATLTGTPTAPTATAGTNTTQLATTAFVQAAKKYKTYIGILNQSSTSAPTVTVIDNELSSAIVWTYSSVGGYVGTLIGAFTNNKTSINFTNGQAGNGIYGAYRISDNAINITSSNSTTGIASNGLIWNATIEVRVYN